MGCTLDLSGDKIKIAYLFDEKEMAKVERRKNPVKTESVSSPQEPDNELKIGELVRSELKRLLIEKATAEEIRLMQEKEYGKKTFGIQYPLLLKTQRVSAFSKCLNNIIGNC